MYIYINRVRVSPRVGVEHWPPYASSIVVELLDLDIDR